MGFSSREGVLRKMKVMSGVVGIIVLEITVLELME